MKKQNDPNDLNLHIVYCDDPEFEEMLSDRQYDSLYGLKGYEREKAAMKRAASWFVQRNEKTIRNMIEAEMVKDKNLGFAYYIE